MSPLLLALCWAGLAHAAPPPPAPAAPAEPVPVSMPDDQRAALFAKAETALASGDRGAAAQALVSVIDDPAASDAHGEAWGRLAELFEAMELDLAAVGAWGQAIALDPKRNATHVGRALAVAEEVGEDRAIARALGQNVGLPVEGATKNQLAYVAARYQLDRDEYGLATAILMLGDKDAPGFEDVEMLRGIVLAQQQRHGDALAPLLTAQALGEQQDRGARFRNLAALNVARAYYSTGDYAQAITWYAKVERPSPYWLDTQFERAWAHFRGNDMNGALAMLFNHDAPFFEDDFHPEADLLRAYALFMMCKFPQASKEMDAFVSRYTAMRDELAAVSTAPADAYADAAAFRRGEPSRLPAYVLGPFAHEERFGDAIRAIERADREAEQAAALPGRAGALARQLIVEQRDERRTVEGQRVLDRVAAARAELDGMLSGIEITRLDLLNLETQMYERAAATGVLDYGDRVGKLRDLRKRKKGFRVWPWQGEYWADELGWFVFDARPDCPEAMSRGEQTP